MTKQLSLMPENPENQLPTTVTSDAALIAVISRAASDPSIDVNKLEKLLEMHDRIEARSAERAFNDAMTAAQTEMRSVAPDATNKQTSSKYASYPALDRALRPIYTKHGFSLSFDTGESAADMVRVLCYVAHTGGHSRTYRADMPADGKGAKGGDVMTKTHAAGSAMSYGQRYLLKLIFNIAVGDDDGNGAGDTSGPIDEIQLENLRDLIGRVGADIEKFCKYFKIASLPELTKKDFSRAVESLNLKSKKVP